MINSGPLRTIELVGWGVGSDDLSIDEDEGAPSQESAETVFTSLGGLVMMPHSAAMAWAVNAKSPVTYIERQHFLDYKLSRGCSP